MNGSRGDYHPWADSRKKGRLRLVKFCPYSKAECRKLECPDARYFLAREYDGFYVFKPLSINKGPRGLWKDVPSSLWGREVAKAWKL